MATSPRQDHDEGDLLGSRKLWEPSSSASSAVLSSDSWQSISHELLYDEYSDAYNDAPACPGLLFRPNYPIMSDSITGNPGSCSSFISRDVSRSMNVLTTPLLASQAARSTRQRFWMDADVQGLGQTTSMDSASPSLLDHAGDSMETALSPNDAVVACGSYDSMTWTAMDGGTPTSMSELLTDMSLRRQNNSDPEDHKTPWEVANTRKCNVNGCTKQFSQQHRYNKHVKSHSRVYRCRYRDCTFSAYQDKDVRRHVSTFHRNVKIPCPVVACQYSRNGPRHGISRKDALKRHLLTHGMTLDEVTTLTSLQSQADNRDRSDTASPSHELSEDSDSFLDFFSFPSTEM